MTRRSRGSLARDSVALFMRTTLRERTLLCKRNIAPKIIITGSKVADDAAVRAAATGSTRNFNNTTNSFLRRKLGRRF